MSGSRSLNDNIDAELDDQFILTIIEFNDSANVNLKKSRDDFKLKMSKSTASFPDTDEQLKILQKRGRKILETNRNYSTRCSKKSQ